MTTEHAAGITRLISRVSSPERAAMEKAYPAGVRRSLHEVPYRPLTRGIRFPQPAPLASEISFSSHLAVPGSFGERLLLVVSERTA